MTCPTLLPITLDRKPGMPPDGAEGTYHIWGQSGYAGTMSHNRFGWQVVGFDIDNLAAVVTITDEIRHMIVAHAPVKDASGMPFIDLEALKQKPLSVQPIPRAAG